MKKTPLKGFRIYRREPLQETFSRVIHQQLQQSLVLCKQFTDVPDFSTHEIRKATKRIRAVYRLFRQATGNEWYQHGRELYSDLSHILAEHRLSRVYCDALQMICMDKRMPADPEYTGELQRKLEERHADFTSGIIRAHKVDRYLYNRILKEVRSGSEKVIPDCTFYHLIPGLQKTYGQCKKCTELAGLQPTTENFHELRKAVKALWNQMILLRPVWPAYYGFMVHHLDVLAQKLGFEHDLAELEKMLSAERSIKNKHQHSLLEFIAGKRLQIQLSILPAARRLFTDKAAAVGTRMEVCYGMFLG